MVDAPRAAAATCSHDVFILSANGSGQGGQNLGRELGQLDSAIRSQLGGVAVKTTVVPYAAEPVATIFTDSKKYESSIEDGRKKTIDKLYELRDVLRSPGCENAQVVLAGFSQGALSIRRALADLASRNSADAQFLKARISQVILVSDPGRRPGENVRSMGGALGFSTGIALDLPGSPRIPTAFAARVTSFCLPGDIVCDFSTVLRGVTYAARFGSVGFGLAAVATAAAIARHGEGYQRNALPSNSGLRALVSSVIVPKAQQARIAREAANPSPKTNRNSSRDLLDVLANFVPKPRPGAKPGPSGPGSNPGPQPPAPAPVPVPVPDGLVCRDLPGVVSDVQPWAGCAQAEDTSSAVVLSIRPADVPAGVPDVLGTGPLASAAGNSSVLLHLNGGSQGAASAQTGSHVDATLDGRSTLVATVSAGAALDALLRDRSTAQIYLDGLSVADVDMARSAHASIDVRGSSRLSADLRAGPSSIGVYNATASVTASDSTVSLSSSSGASATLQASDRAVVSGSTYRSRSDVIASGSSVIYSVGSDSALTLDAGSGSFLYVAADDQSTVTATSTGARATIHAQGGSAVSSTLSGTGQNARANLNAEGGAKLDVEVTNNVVGGQVAGVDASVQGPIDVEVDVVGDGSAAALRIGRIPSGADDVPVTPVVTIRSENGGSVTVTASASSGRTAGLSGDSAISASATGAGSSVLVDAAVIVGALALMAEEGGRAFYIVDAFDVVTFGCEGGRTSVATEAGSCESNGSVARYRYADGREVVVGEPPSGPTPPAPTDPGPDPHPSPGPDLGSDPASDANRPADADSVAGARLEVRAGDNSSNPDPAPSSADVEDADEDASREGSAPGPSVAAPDPAAPDPAAVEEAEEVEADPVVESPRRPVDDAAEPAESDEQR
ncbi:cutinase family protein [Rhodococcoides kroppenstedtii]|uniref:cutinase family protein n=1 Tax=Rhodococcoides kroppenstedtii TaxID=293050 RepID=UPI003625A8EE